MEHSLFSESVFKRVFHPDSDSEHQLKCFRSDNEFLCSSGRERRRRASRRRRTARPSSESLLLFNMCHVFKCSSIPFIIQTNIQSFIMSSVTNLTIPLPWLLKVTGSLKSANLRPYKVLNYIRIVLIIFQEVLNWWTGITIWLNGVIKLQEAMI